MEVTNIRYAVFMTSKPLKTMEKLQSGIYIFAWTVCYCQGPFKGRVPKKRREPFPKSNNGFHYNGQLIQYLQRTKKVNSCRFKKNGKQYFVQEIWYISAAVRNCYHGSKSQWKVTGNGLKFRINAIRNSFWNIWSHKWSENIFVLMDKARAILVDFTLKGRHPKKTIFFRT